MELIYGKASKFAPEDFISNLPDNVITHILDRLPFQYAVRTGILSRNWRFKWTTLSQLVFDEKFFDYLFKRESYKNYEGIISRLLLHHEGAITKFVLYLLEDYDIANWILFLSRKGVKDLTIFKKIGKPLELPIHIFSCLELKHLNLHNCCFDPPARFHGFPNLLSLELGEVEFESGEFCDFFSTSPVLDILNIYSADVKLVEIAKLTNLKILSLKCDLDPTSIINSSTIFELVGFLPKLQELKLDFTDYKSFAEDDDARKRPPTTFPCLKTLKLLNIDFGSGIMLSFAFEVISSSPNLQTLKITAGEQSSPEEDGANKMPPATFPCLRTLKFSNISLGNGFMLSFAFEIIRSSPNLRTLQIRTGEQDVDPPHAVCYPKVDYNTTEMLRLRSVVFIDLEASENIVCLIKYILACSPLLEKIVIHAHTLAYDEKLMFATKLMELHRASPVAIINVCDF